MSDFSTRMKAHLAEYKREHLKIEADGLWRSNNKPYAHILPESESRQNILDSIRDDFWKYYESKRDTLACHTDFHHLNSSQAFAFNLFFPWLTTPGAAGLLLERMGVPDGRMAGWDFEAMPDQAEGTCVDLLLTLESGSRVLVEVKLTEQHFGSVMPKDSHRAKREATYAKGLDGKLLAEAPESLFFENYQLFRNLSHLNLANGDQLVLLLPRANARTWRQGEQFLELLSERARGFVRMVAVEDLIAGLETDARGSEALAGHMRSLRRKYLPEGLS